MKSLCKKLLQVYDNNPVKYHDPIILAHNA